MAKLGNRFSTTFGVDAGWLKAKGVFDPTLDLDAPLFIDPFLLAYSKHKEFSSCAFDAYDQHFGTLFSLVRMIKVTGDKAWLGARSKLLLGEQKGLHGTCLGYSKASTHGRGMGPILAAKSIEWSKSVIEMGVQDPELFLSLPLFEDGIGPDMISDMVANIAADCIVAFNRRIIKEITADLGVKLTSSTFVVKGKTVELLQNPYDNKPSPVLLLADDVLKFLPLLYDVTLLPGAAESNANIRERANKYIGEIFKVRYKREKEHIKNEAMRSANSFQALLDLLKILEKTPYDVQNDPAGLFVWRNIADNFTAIHKLQIDEPKGGSKIDRVDRVVVAIIEKFRDLVEKNRLNRVFYSDDFKPRHERFAQLLFYAVAESYCRANNLDISPESDAGAGPVDFKMSSGTEKVLVEIKLSTNGKVVSGYKKQLGAYVAAELAQRGHYVLIDIGESGNKWRDLKSIQSQNAGFAKLRPIHLIDGTLKASASKL